MSDPSDLEELSESQLVAIDEPDKTASADDLEEETVEKADKVAFAPVPAPLRVLRTRKAIAKPAPPAWKPSPLPPLPTPPARATATPMLPPPPRLPTPLRELPVYDEQDSTSTNVVPVERRASRKRTGRPVTRWRSKHAPVWIGAAVGGVLFVLVAVMASVLGRSPTATASSAGGVIVTVAGPGGSPVDSPAIDVDGARRCDASPCRISGLGDTVALISISAPGFVATSPRAVRVTSSSLAALHIELEPLEYAEPEAESEAIATDEPRPRAPVKKPRAAKPVATSAWLDLSATPTAAVVVDGRPLGHTPRMGVAVAPGAHEVVFMHPDKGRRSRSVHVEPGARRSVAVRF
jgi:hypothetical protein